MRLDAESIFSILVIILLSGSSFAPFAYAQTPPSTLYFEDAAPTPVATPVPTVERVGASCTITTFDEVEGRRFLDAVYDFNGKALTDKSTAALKDSVPPNSSTIINNNIYNFPTEESTRLMSLSEAARILGKDPAEVADDLGVETNETVTAAQVRAIAENDPQSGGALDKLRAFMASKSTKPEDQVKVPGFEQMRIKLPNGKDVPLSDIYRYQALRDAEGSGGSCLLQNSDIRGKVSYIGLLDKNLLIGADRADNTLDQNIEGVAVSQHLNTESIRAGLTNSDGNVVVPSYYEKAIAFIGAWNKIDMFITAWSAANAFTSKAALEKEQALIAERIERQKTVNSLVSGSERPFYQAAERVDDFVAQSAGLTGVSGEPIGTGVYREYSNAWVSSRFGAATRMETPQELTSYVERLMGSTSLSVPVVPPGATAEQAAQIAERAQQIAAYNTRLASAQTNIEQQLELGGGGDLATNLQNYLARGDNADAQLTNIQRLLPNEFSGNSIDSIRNTAVVMRADDKIGALQGDIKTASRWQDLATSRAYTTFAMGLLWLGPARFALEISEPIVFSSDVKPDAKRGDYFLLFANDNTYAQSFKKGSDFFFSGTFISMASDFLGHGVPSKLFNVGNLIFIQEPGNSGSERNSFTSLGKSPDGGWMVQTDWIGQSDVSAFEDIHDGRKMTSLAVQTNYLRLGGQLNRKEELQEYYHTLLLIIPLLGWKLSAFGSLDARLITILRVQTLQYYIDNLIDPNEFNADDACNEKTFGAMKNWYRFATTLSIAEQALLQSQIYGKAGAGLVGGLNRIATSTLGKKYFSSKTATYLDPAGLFKYFEASRILNYASTCKDPSYKIMAYQNIEKSTTVGAIKDAATQAKDKASDPLGLNNLLGGLNIGQALSGAGDESKAEQLDEVLNVRSILTNQNGQVKPQEIYYLHLDADSSNIEWFNVFDANACFRQCLESDDAVICADKGGISKTDKETGETTYLADSEHGLMTEFLPGLGMVVPNKIISTVLSCGSDPVMRFKGDGSVSIVGGNCEAMQCTTDALGRVAGENVGSNLAPLGAFRGLHTSQAIGNPDGGEIRMFRTTGSQVTGVLAKDRVEGDTAVPEAQSSGGSGLANVAGAAKDKVVGKSESIAGREKRYNAVELLGNAAVRGSGSSLDLDQYGTFQTATFDNGVMHYDAATRKLYIALRVLAQAPGRDIKSVAATPEQVAGPKADLQEQNQKILELLDKLATNQRLSQEEMALLRRALDRPTLSGEGLSDAEKTVLNEALRKQSAGIPLNQAEQSVVEKARETEKYPGVITLPASVTNIIERSLKETNTMPQERADQIVTDLREGRPIAQQDAVDVVTALDKAVAQSVVSSSDAAEAKQAVPKAVAATDQSAAIAEAVNSGAPLSDSQREAAMAAVKAEQQRIEAAAATAPDSPVTGIKLSNVVAKPGAEDSARELNTALEQVGALTHFVTDNKIVDLAGTDEAGNSVIRIGDKATGEFQEFKVTGPATKDGTAAVFPTDQGPVKVDVTVNPQTGAPILNLNAPNNIQEKAPLVLAQSPAGGLLYYDPATGTWQVRNGFAVPADASFRQGASFFGGDSGTTAVGEGNRLAYQNPLSNTGGSSNNPLLALPSWSDGLVGVLMLLVVLLGALFVRRRG